MIARRPSVAPVFTAIACLTRIPVRNALCTPEAIGRATGAFPLVGLLAGALNIAILEVLRSVLPPTLIAILIVLGGLLLTGGFHFDGLADTADGFGGGWTRDDVLRIMRDHQIGTFGTLALVVTLMLQVAAIAALIEHGSAGQALIVAPTVGRWGIVVLGRWLPYARPDGGLGRAVADHVGNREAFVATLLAIVIALVAAGPEGLLSLATAFIVTGLFGWMCKGRIGGLTGDTLGADAVLCETLALIVAVARS